MHNTIFFRPCSPSKTKTLRSYFLIITFTVISIHNACSQRKLSPQAEKAIDFFNKNQYNIAFAEFQKLIDKYPKDPLYQFYMGATMVETNTSNLQAISYLKNVTLQNTIPRAWYYLGKAYYRQFRFSDALDAFNEMKNTASKPDNKILETNKEIKRTENAQLFFSKKTNINISASNICSADSLELKVVNKLGNEFQLIEMKPYRSSISGKGKSSIYFANKGEEKKSDKDIFRITLLSDGSYSDPENLGIIINSDEDEDFPYFDELTHTLYFASKGHNSVGGYDIFESVFDVNSQTWSTPHQLPFPINTPWNDYYWIETNSLKLLASDRDNTLNFITIYDVWDYNFSDSTLLKNADEMLQACQLMETKRKTKPKNSQTYTKPEVRLQEPINTETSNHVKISNYQFLNEALKAQTVADSALLLVRYAKIKLNKTDDTESRAALFSIIAKNEKLAKANQKIADDNYSKAFDIKATNITKTQSKDSTKANLFGIEKQTQYTNSNPFPTDITLPDGIVYRIQIGVYSKQRAFDSFGGLNPISAEILQDGKLIKYYVGIFSSFEQADSSLIKVKEKGFKEAFVVGYLNNKKIPLERAKDIEEAY